MQPIGQDSRYGREDVNGSADAFTDDFARFDTAPSSMRIFMIRSMRSFRSLLQSSLMQSKFFKAMALGIPVVAAGYFLMPEPKPGQSGVIASLSSQAGFEADKLVINGNTHLDVEDLKRKLSVQLGGSLFNFDVEDMREHIMSSPWVKQVEIRKVYPDTIVVDLQERVPVALWKSDGVVNIISAEGNVISEAGLEHMRLPQVVGNGANNAASEFLSYITKFTDITAQAKAYVRVADRRWNIHLNNGPKIMLPEHDWKAALAELNELHFSKNIFDRDIVQVDMRLPDRLVFKMSSEQAKIRKTAIEKALKKKWHKI